MNTLFEQIKSSKKYNGICDDTIHRLCVEEAGKYKSDKEAVKSIKSRLHQMTGAFVGDNAIKHARQLVESWEDQSTVKQDCRQIMRLFASSDERLDFFEEMYTDIFSVLHNPGSILDMACGFNPFAFPFVSQYETITYYASDIHLKSIALLQIFFQKANIKGQAFAFDILTGTPAIEADVVFLFKILPLLEQQKKDYSRDWIRSLACKQVVITFPTRSLSGRNVGMYGSYTKMMEQSFGDCICFVKEYKNELLFIINQREGEKECLPFMS